MFADDTVAYLNENHGLLKYRPGHGQWALLKLEACCYVISPLFSMDIAGFSAKSVYSWNEVIKYLKK